MVKTKIALLCLPFMACTMFAFGQKGKIKNTNVQAEVQQTFDTSAYKKLPRLPEDLTKLITYARPSIKIPDDIYKDIIYALANMEFQNDNKELTSKSEIFLYDFLHFLRANENYKIKLSSYVNLGNNEDNLEISKRRLEALKKFLVDGGISKSRIKGLYFGDKMPVIDLPLTRFEVEFDK